MNEALLLAMTAASGGGGGGGSSDFSTCELTFVNNSEDTYYLEVACVSENNEYTYGGIANEGFQQEEIATVILYKGHAYATFLYGNMPPASNISVSGNIVYDNVDNYFTITGNGTITISD